MSIFKISLSAAIILVAMLLKGCSGSPSSSENLDLDSFSFVVDVGYFRSSGEGLLYIDLEYDAFLSPDTNIGLGRGDAFVITSGDYRTVVDSIPSGIARLPIKVDPSAELSVDFQRNGLSVKKIVATVSELLIPSITTDVSALDLNTISSNASLDFGIEIPHSIGSGERFGYGAVPTGCYSESGDYTEFENVNVLGSSFGGAFIPIGSVLDESTLNPTIEASFFVLRENENLVSGVYKYCETILFTSVALTRPNVTDTNSLLSYVEEGDANGGLKLRILSDPIMMSVDESALQE